MSPHPRGHGGGEGWAVRESPVRGRMLSGGGHPHPNLPPSRGKGFVGAEWAIFIVMTSFRRGMGPRMREDTGKGRLFFHVFTGAGSAREKRGGVGGWVTTRDVPSGDGRGDGSPHPRGHGGGEGWAVRESPVRGRMLSGGGHPHPNLPPSRGKGFVGAEWAIFIVMTSFRRGMGPRIREDNGGDGRSIFPVFTGADYSRE